MKIIEELLPGVFILKSKLFEDDRGFLHTPFHADEFFKCVGHKFEVTQTMYTRSFEKVMRGLHYQNNSVPVAKLISCSRGGIYDVIVDLRVQSKTFGQWVNIQLDYRDDLQVYAPIGTAHGFMSLSHSSDVFYYQAGNYVSEASCILAWDDPDLAITWPFDKPELSDRDRTQGISWKSYKNNPMF